MSIVNKPTDKQKAIAKGNSAVYHQAQVEPVYEWQCPSDDCLHMNAEGVDPDPMDIVKCSECGLIWEVE